VIPVERVPADLFAPAREDEARSRARMAVLDAVNRRYGRGTLRFAGQRVGGALAAAGRADIRGLDEPLEGLPTVRAG
jgi:DNA polymerase V